MLFLLAVSLLLYQQVAGLIPGLCVTNGQPNSNRICCPSPNIPNAGACGSNLSPSRGSCSPLSAILPNLVINAAGDTRENWPYYFDYLCKCNGNYWGYDCSQCAFGYTMVGGICTQQQVPRKRKSTADLTIAEREQYLNAISQSKLNSSYTRYMAIRKESNPPAVVQLSLYNLFAWLHYYAGKENDLLRNNDCKDSKSCMHHLICACVLHDRRISRDMHGPFPDLVRFLIERFTFRIDQLTLGRIYEHHSNHRVTMKWSIDYCRLMAQSRKTSLIN